MKTLMLFLSLSILPASAAHIQVDPSILGEYALQPATPSSEVQVAQVRYNVENDLIVAVNDSEYEFSAASGVVYDEEGEPNCDGDESACYYDARTRIQLQTVLSASGEKIPQLTLEITKVDAFDDSGRSAETNTYVLNWTRSIPDAIPFFLTAKNPAKLLAFLKACEAAVKPTVGYGGIGSVSAICSIANSFKFRGSFEEAMPFFLNYHGAAELISADRLQRGVFRDVESIVKSRDARELKVSIEALLEQTKKLEAYILASDKVYYSQFADLAVLYAVNLKTKIITVFMVKNKK